METTTLYRIIDANFNRAREALRVMEEYARFGLDNASLSARAKQLRHRLCDTIGRFDALTLLSSRDTAGDVGRELKVEGQLKRQSLQDCFTAAAKRASEALRALAEACQPIDSEASAVMEQLRFGVYALEKETALSGHIRAKFEPVRLYVLINAGPDTDTPGLLSLVRQCIAGGADALQLRAKNLDDKPLLALAHQFVRVCRDSGALSIINDRADIAILAQADGVHLGQNEIPVSDARTLARRPLIIGGSTHNLDELREAITAGYDYVGVGPAFASQTKPDVQVAGPKYLKDAAETLSESGILPVAIGGIDEHNITQVITAGIRCVAVSSCICRCPNPQAYCKTLKDRLLTA
jgi:thiamine-phosphate pyrophosphorylase